jgi:TonB-linked SusC/RagA family outer membrane protein
MPALAQSRLLTGKITDQEGQPIPFASIRVKQTRAGTSADADGNFSIRVKNSETLVISGAGIVPRELEVGDATVLNIKVARKNTSLAEVVVTALGIQNSKDKLATSQSSIKGQAIAESGETSVLNGLSSKASGVQVVRSGGEPGEGTYIQIRGQSTITGDLQPLFVIDGVPVFNTSFGMSLAGTSQQSRLSDINPSDIASVEVLKGAAAAALYGTRAANGVVLITTKKGKANGKINISLNTTYSLDVLNKSVPLQTTFGQGTGGVYKYGNRLSWGDIITDRAGGADLTTGTAHFLMPDGTERFAVPSGTTANPHGGKNSKTLYDHSKELFHNGYFLDNTLKFSGGDDKTVYYASLSNLAQKGSLKAGSDYYRKSFTFNADRRFNKNIHLSTNFMYSNVTSHRAQQGSNLSGIFLGGLRSPVDFDNSVYQGTYVDAGGALYPNRQAAYRNPIGANTNSIYDNPFWIIHNVLSTTEVNRALGSFEANIEATPWLSFLARAGVDFYSDDRTDNYPVLSANFPGGDLTIQELSELQFNTDLMAKFSAPMTSTINFTGLVGFNYNNRKFENSGTDVKSFILPDAPLDLGNSAASSRFPFNSNSLVRTTASYAQLNFDAFDQLVLNLTGRAEQASTFANTFFYPSASLGWQFTKLKGLDGGNTLSFGKLRASYGEVGVQPAPYLTNTYYVTASSNVIAEGFGSTLDASSPVYGGGYLRNTLKGNPNIKPERKKEYELGVDLRFFSNKVSFSGTYYSNKTTGAIFGVSVPSTTGFQTINDNAAELENHGVEADLGITWFKTANGIWNISTSLTWSKNKNKVLSLKGTKQFGLAGFASVISSAVPGYALGAFWGVGYARDAKGNFVLDGNGFPTVAPDNSVLGDPNPDWIGAVNNTIRYKTVTLSFLFDHVEGGDVWNGTRGALTTIGTAAETGTMATAKTDIKDYDGNTVAAGTTFRGSIANFGAGPVALNQSWYSSIGGGFGSATGPQFFEKGTRTRLREIGLGYSLTGPNFRQKTKLQSIDFSFTGRNIVLWSHYKGIDPETNLSGPTNGRGIDYFNNPSTRSYLFTIKINY